MYNKVYNCKHRECRVARVYFDHEGLYRTEGKKQATTVVAKFFFFFRNGTSVHRVKTEKEENPANYDRIRVFVPIIDIAPSSKKTRAT